MIMAILYHFLGTGTRIRASAASNAISFRTLSLVTRSSSPSCSSASSAFESVSDDAKGPCSSTQSHQPLARPFRRLTDSEDRKIQWVFLGCPGVGKGTYASMLSNLLGVPHIATGDLARHEISSNGPLSSQLAEIVNQGKLVPDEIVISLLSKRLEASRANGESGFILDGFPRTLGQSEILDKLTDIDLVINLKLREEALLAKCLGRRICSECGGNFNVACIDIKPENGNPGIYMAPILPPPGCASKLVTRSDDTEEVVRERLRIYKEMSQPVEEFYRTCGKLLEFDLPGGIPESWPKLIQALNLDDGNDKQFAAA